VIVEAAATGTPSITSIYCMVKADCEVY